MKRSFDASGYKKNMVNNWNEVAPKYHNRWADRDMGPFYNAQELVRSAGVQKGDSALDIACGTGAVISSLLRAVGPDGLVVGADVSSAALSIAKSQAACDGAEFVLMDAERFCFGGQFDVVTCQLGLFLLADSQQALCNIRECLKDGGTLAVSVHEASPPFHKSVMSAVIRFIPDCAFPGAPNLDRLGTEDALRDEASRAGFADIRTGTLESKYAVGTFDKYWEDYLQFIPSTMKAKIEALSASNLEEMRGIVKENTSSYTGSDGEIVFPWRILTMTAKR